MWGRRCFSISHFPDKARKVTENSCKIENKVRLPFETGTGVELVLRWVSTAEERAGPARTVVGVARGGVWEVIWLQTDPGPAAH